MTTIAARDGEIAGDGRETDADIVIRDTCCKIWRLPDGSLLGAAGSSEDCMRLYLALKSKQPLPKLEECSAIMIKPNGSMVLFEGNIWQPIEQKYYAVGSGAGVAFGAMDAGATAKRAATIGSKRDPFSGGKVRSLRLCQRQSKKPR